MNDTTINKSNEKSARFKYDISAYLKFTIFRIVFIVWLILSLTVLKFLFNGIFQNIKSFYNDNVSINISEDYFNSLGRSENYD